MKYGKVFTGLVVLFFTSCTSHQPSDLIVEHLRCEYLVKPEGIDVREPRLSWQLRSETSGRMQTAYQVMVSSDSAKLMTDEADIWDSKKVNSDQTTFVAYAGNVLQSGKKYFWKVRSWDEAKQVSSWSPVASWSMGLLDSSDWKAKWIGDVVEEIPVEMRYNIHSGYRSAAEKTADKPKSIVIDLQSEQRFTNVRLYPALIGKDLKVYAFPEAFKILVSKDESFSQAEKIAQESNYKQSGAEPFNIAFKPVTARYVKLIVTRQPAVEDGFAFALGEVEVLNENNKNIAFGKKVKADDTYLNYSKFSNEKWWSDLLTDGFVKPNHLHKTNSIDIPSSPLLRKNFTVSGSVKRASLYVTALGLYEMSLNGKKAGDHLLAPEWTDYHTRVQYQTYDITHLINEGENVLGAMLADGWYAGTIFSHPNRGSYGFSRKLLAQLQLEYEDGSSEVVVTDESWKLKKDGPVKAASIFDGETFDANKNIKGWNENGFDDGGWQPVTVYDKVPLLVTVQMNEPIKVVQEVKAINVIAQKNGTYIFDLGQNIAGWVALKIPYNPGQKIVFRHGEVLDEKGALYTDNLRGAKQINSYIPGNESSVDYEPRFTYHGFRYVEISGLTQKPEAGNVIGKVVASSSPVTGTFESSSKDLNKLWENILWTQRGNMHSTPTDCPQRDERAGWMGDAQVFSTSAIFNMDMGAFFTKWIGDIRDAQTDEGRFPDYAPQVATWANFYNSPGWGDAGVIVPWRLYEHYGDDRILAVQYESMKRFIASVLKYNPDHLWKHARGNMYGDWLNGNTIIAADYPKDGGQVPDDVYSTAFFYYSTNIVAQTAHILGKKEDVGYFESMAKSIKDAFVKNYIKDNGVIEGNTQAGYALALDFGLVPEALQIQAAAHMADAVKAYDFRMSTGIQTTIRLMNQLTKFGYSDLAYQLIESRRFPSWIYSIDQGATTIWERWDGYVEGRGFQNVGMNSFNHYAIGAVGEWMYRTILGINNDPTIPGYRHFYINPVPGGSLTHAKGSYQSIAGTIDVDWVKAENSFKLAISVPANTTATVTIPFAGAVTVDGKDIKGANGIKVLESKEGETRMLVTAGKYDFQTAW